MNIQILEVRVEVPETDDIFVVTAESTWSVYNVISSTPVPLKAISKITYNGARVLVNQTLSYLHFANKSALIVYLTSVATVENVIPACNDNGVMSGTGTDSGNPELPSGSGHITPSIPIPPVKNDLPREPMKEPAVVTMHIDDQSFLDFPVLVQPEHYGLILFDALKQRTGRNFIVMNLLFLGTKIEQETPLKPLGLLNGDIINVVLLPPPQLGFDPNANPSV